MSTDYLVIGAGAMGMAFADVIVTETDATVTLVDRRGRPGGHWNDAYDHVRLHQPSAYYGVSSRELGSGRVDDVGGNAGLYELASGAEVLAYYDRVLHHDMLPSGRVRFLPLTEHLGDGSVRSLASGRTEDIVPTRAIVDASYMNVTVPAMRPAPFPVEDGMLCAPPGGINRLPEGVADYVVMGGGKTGMDAVLRLLELEVPVDRIRWVVPRDSWLLDRANIQPGADFALSTVRWFAGNVVAAAEATDVDDLFRRLEANGLLWRLHEDVQPEMYRCATVTAAELEGLRAVDQVIRLGRVRRIGAVGIELDGGTVPTTPSTLHVDCTADGLERRPAVPVFDGDRITLQAVRTCQQVFSAALLGHVEVSYDDDTTRNELSVPVPHPDTPLDWLRCQLQGQRNSMRWQAEPALQEWLGGCRLDPFSVARLGNDPAALEAAMPALANAETSVTNLERMLAGVDG